MDLDETCDDEIVLSKSNQLDSKSSIISHLTNPSQSSSSPRDSFCTEPIPDMQTNRPGQFRIEPFDAERFKYHWFTLWFHDQARQTRFMNFLNSQLSFRTHLLSASCPGFSFAFTVTNWQLTLKAYQLPSLLGVCSKIVIALVWLNFLSNLVASFLYRPLRGSSPIYMDAEPYIAQNNEKHGFGLDGDAIDNLTRKPTQSYLDFSRRHAWITFLFKFSFTLVSIVSILNFLIYFFADLKCNDWCIGHIPLHALIGAWLFPFLSSAITPSEWILQFILEVISKTILVLAFTQFENSSHSLPVLPIVVISIFWIYVLRMIYKRNVVAFQNRELMAHFIAVSNMKYMEENAGLFMSFV